jgi:hypothetical protein
MLAVVDLPFVVSSYYVEENVSTHCYDDKNQKHSFFSFTSRQRASIAPRLKYLLHIK